MLPLFALAIFLSAALLFLVQPLTAKLILPLLGGSPSVWNSAMLFFQAMLLLGYFYSFLLTKLRTAAAQLAFHAVLVLVVAFTLPISLPPIHTDALTASPTRAALYLLLLSAGAPFFAVATTGPLLQRWFSRTTHAAARDPYFLYAASNAGSVLGLLAYPFLLEPVLDLTGQARTWSLGYYALAPLLLACGFLAVRRARPDTPPSEASAAASSAAPAPLWSRRLLWVFLAAVPSSLTIGVTQNITTDVAAVPLLWVIPLLLYLLSFILAFQSTVPFSAALAGRILPIFVVLVLLTTFTAARSPLPLIAGLHLALLFTAASMCHRRLHDLRPDPAHLTEFYLCLAVGGVLGGAFNTLLAPFLFNALFEYPLAVAAACLLRPQSAAELPRSRWSRWGLAGAAALALAFTRYYAGTFVDWLGISGVAYKFVAAGIPCILCYALLFRAGARRFALAVLLLFAINIPISRAGNGTLLYARRSFFGVNEVYASDGNWYHSLTHGTTIHGIQMRAPDMRRIPTTYYHRSGPIGDVFEIFTNDPARRPLLNYLAFVGMGTGSLAAYLEPNQNAAFFEIDPAVVRIATDPDLFSYIPDARARGANIQIVLGDARLSLASLSDQTPKFGVIVIDAFTSDAIPVHLMTLEAIQTYRARLHPQGVLAIHVSNRYFELRPVLASLAQHLGMSAVAVYDPKDDNIDQIRREQKFASVWVLLANEPAVLAPFKPSPYGWNDLAPPQPPLLWTDAHSSLLKVLARD